MQIIYLSFRSISPGNWIYLTIFLGSGLLHVFATVMISYYQRQYQKQDNTVYIIKLQTAESPNNTTSSERVLHETSPRVNTSEYNKILLQVNNMMSIGAYVVITMIITILARNDIPYFNYLQEFLPAIMLGIIIPCIFYVRNSKARLFIKECFVKR